MKRLFIFCCCLLWMTQALAQCPSGDITLSSQSAVNAFQTTYPNCTQLFRDLVIDGSTITDLTPLNIITGVGGSLKIQNTSISSFDGIPDNITIGTNFLISNNSNLLDMSGFPSNLTIDQALQIGGNTSLKNLIGMKPFTTISLNISSNSNLESLIGLKGINLISANPFFLVANNPKLLLCEVDAVCSYANPITFTMNGDPCNSKDIVTTRCAGKYSLSTSMPANSCSLYKTVEISTAQENNSMWYPILDDSGHILCAINANGNDLGSTDFHIYRHTGSPIRRDANNIPYLDRNFAITPTTQPTTPVSIRFYFTDADKYRIYNADNSAVADIDVSKFNTACKPYPNGEGVFIAQNSSLSFSYNDFVAIPQINQTNHYIQIDVSTFSNFFLNGQNQLLPLIWTAKPSLELSKDQIDVSWSVESEFNVEHYEVYHSMDGRSFEQVAKLKAINTEAEKQYNFNYNNPANGQHYFKIRAVDFDQSSMESSVATINYGMNKAIELYPNPAQHLLQLRHVDSGTAYEIISQDGQIQATGIYEEYIDISRLTPGIYSLKINDNYLRFVKR